MVRIILESPTPQEMADWAAQFLEGFGYTVTRGQGPRPAETPQELADRLGVSRRHVLRRLTHPGCPPARVIYSQGARVSMIFATPELDEFMKRKLRSRPS